MQLINALSFRFYLHVYVYTLIYVDVHGMADVMWREGWSLRQVRNAEVIMTKWEGNRMRRHELNRLWIEECCGG